MCILEMNCLGHCKMGCFSGTFKSYKPGPTQGVGDAGGGGVRTYLHFDVNYFKYSFSPETKSI